MSEDSGTIEYQRSETTGRGMRDTQQPYILPWPAMEGFAYPLPKELFLLLDKTQTSLEIRNIVLSSVNKAEKATAGFEELETPEDGFANPKMVEISQSSESSSVMTVASPSDQSHSRSTSSGSLSLHINQNTNSNESGTRLGLKKATLSTFFSSTTNLIGCVKQAMKSPSTAEKDDSSERSKKLGRSW